MRIGNDEVKIIKKSIYLALIITIVILVLCIFIDKFPYTFILSYVIGYLANIVGFIKINNTVNKILNFDTTNPKRATMTNYFVNYLIYVAVLLLSYYFGIYHLIFTFLGLVTIKTIIIFDSFKIN